MKTRKLSQLEVAITDALVSLEEEFAQHLPSPPKCWVKADIWEREL